MDNYLNWLQQQQPPYKYVITGCDYDGRRFKPIKTNTPDHYNIAFGTLWILIDNKRKKVKEYYRG